MSKIGVSRRALKHPGSIIEDTASAYLIEGGGDRSVVLRRAIANTLAASAKMKDPAIGSTASRSQTFDESGSSDASRKR